MPEPSRCPKCGTSCLLTTAPILVYVLEGGRAGHVYGRPDVVPLRGDQSVFCNYAHCRWEGKVSDLRPPEAES